MIYWNYHLGRCKTLVQWLKVCAQKDAVLVELEVEGLILDGATRLFYFFQLLCYSLLNYYCSMLILLLR